MAGGGVQGFYRQKKKGDVSKAKQSPAAKKPSKKKLPQHNCSQSQDCGDHGDEVEEQLRLFDMDMTYGPCIGITRLRRWERAAAMGLCPPLCLRDLLLPTPSPPVHPLPSSSSSPVKILTTTTTTTSTSTSVKAQCLWAGKVS